MPATLGNGITIDQVYVTDPGMTNYVWALSSAGTITAPADPTLSNSITVTWTNPTGQQFVSVSYTGSTTATLIINYYPFPAAIDPATGPQFVDPLPHFAGGLRVIAIAGGNMTITTRLVTQRALSTGTPLAPGATGMGNYAGYEITYNGTTYPAMWPARTIETQQDFLKVQYVNGLGECGTANSIFWFKH
jgi:hypothetical protein